MACNKIVYGAPSLSLFLSGVEEATPEVEQSLKVIEHRRGVLDRVSDRLANKLKAIHENKDNMEKKIDKRAEELIR